MSKKDTTTISAFCSAIYFCSTEVNKKIICFAVRVESTVKMITKQLLIEGKGIRHYMKFIPETETQIQSITLHLMQRNQVICVETCQLHTALVINSVIQL